MIINTPKGEVNNVNSSNLNIKANQSEVFRDIKADAFSNTSLISHTGYSGIVFYSNSYFIPSFFDFLKIY